MRVVSFSATSDGKVDMGEVMELQLSCYLVLPSIDGKTRWQDSHSFVTSPISIWCHYAATNWQVLNYIITHTANYVQSPEFFVWPPNFLICWTWVFWMISVFFLTNTLRSAENGCQLADGTFKGSIIDNKSALIWVLTCGQSDTGYNDTGIMIRVPHDMIRISIQVAIQYVSQYLQ